MCMRNVKKEIKIKDVLAIIKHIKQKNVMGVDYNNYYNKYNSSDNDVVSWKGDNSIVFIVSEEYVNRTFFYSSDIRELSELLKLVPKGCVLDYVSKELPKELDGALSVSGFVQHAIYARRTLPVPYETTKGDRKFKELMKRLYKPDLGEPATNADIPEIKRIMFETFDPINSDIPTSDELLEDIKNKNVWIYKLNDEIVTMYIYRIYGNRRYGAMTYNRLSADYLSSLVTNANLESERTHSIKFHYGWIDISNKKIIRSLEKEGVLGLDGIRNYIFQKCV